jgi:hypothetical protein
MSYRWLVSSVVRHIGRIVTIFALCCAIGLHWLTLQSIAWTSMIIDYSKRGTLCQAIAQTFDGAHPCSLCHIVNKGKSAEKKSDLQLPTPKLDLICTQHAITLALPYITFDYAKSNFRISEVGHSPPVPPPRSILI